MARVLVAATVVCGCVMHPHAQQLRVSDASALCNTAVDEAVGTTWHRFGNRVHYVDLEFMPWRKLDRTARVPGDLRRAALKPLDNLHHPAAFERTVLGILARQGYDARRLRTLSPRRAVLLAVRVVVDRLTFANVDILSEFSALRRKHHGLYNAVDVCFDIGKGDCDKYADLVCHVFAILKTRNPRLANVFVVAPAIGADSTRHDPRRYHRWNAVLLIARRAIYVAHIDPTIHDIMRARGAVGEDGTPYPGLQASDHHVKPRHVRANFYWEIGDRAHALPLYLDLLRREHTGVYRAEFYDRAAAAAYAAGDLALVGKLETAFEREHLDGVSTAAYVSVVYFAALAEHDRLGTMRPVLVRLDKLTRVAANSLLTRILAAMVHSPTTSPPPAPS